MSTATVTPQQVAHDRRDTVVRLPGRFMFDAATMERGRELGFEGFDFYVAGRAGALGDVPADVVVAAFVFFPPGTLRAAWERSASVMPRRTAAAEWAACAHDWARARLHAAIDWARAAALLGRVVASADAAAAPLFAAWRTLGEPDDPRALFLHRLNALRELRGALHGAAVLTVGLTPHEASSVRAPDMMAMMGWSDGPAAAAPLRERWLLAEARTDRMLGRHLAVLESDELTELAELLAEADR